MSEATATTYQLLDGKKLADEIKSEIAAEVSGITAGGKRAPHLAAILVGNDGGSLTYVGHKVKACEQVGFKSTLLHFTDTSITEEFLLNQVKKLNEDPEIDGFIVQLPLPKHIDADKVLMAVDPAKDVDGFHPCNVGNLVANSPGPRACTPAGIMELLRRYEIPVAGRRAVVIGRSDIVGKPMALLLLHQNATVTICHSRTVNLAEECHRADILVAAIGRAALVTRDFIKPGATVIDVGMNRLTDRGELERIYARTPEKLKQLEQKGSILLGDVHPIDGPEVAGAFTPVPGGVGPLTIAMLMSNTVRSAERRLAPGPEPR